MNSNTNTIRRMPVSNSGSLPVQISRIGRPTSLRRLAAFGLVAANLLGVAAAQQGFNGPYRLEQWNSSGITGGRTAIGRDPADSIQLSYDVDLGNPGPGVPERSATYETIATSTGSVTLDWSWSGFHAFSRARGGLTIFARTAGGRRSERVVPIGSVFGNFNRSGSVTLNVERGMELGVVVTGSNFDRNSRLRGTISLSGLGNVRDFVGAYEVQKWTDLGISDGVTDLVPKAGRTDTMRYAYAVSLPGGGVSRRSAVLENTADRSGRMRFKWSWSGNHRFFSAVARLHARIETPTGVVTEDLLPNRSVSGSFQFSGTADFLVHRGRTVSLVVTGKNFDRESRINGAVTLTDFEILPPVDLALSRWTKSGISGGTTALAHDLVTPSAGAVFDYAVRLGSNGVPRRTTDFTMTAVDDGTIAFDWRYSGFHAFFQAEAVLEVVVNRTRTVLVDSTVSGNFGFSGDVEFRVRRGDSFGIRVGGENFDTNAQLRGSVILNNFAFTKDGSIVAIPGVTGCGVGGTFGVNGPFAVGNEDFKITLTGASQLAIQAVLMLDPSLTAPSPLCGTRCGDVILPSVSVLAPALRGGEAQLALPLPRDPATVGFSMFAQWVVVGGGRSDCSFSSLLQLSDGVQLTMHR